MTDIIINTPNIMTELIKPKYYICYGYILIYWLILLNPKYYDWYC